MSGMWKLAAMSVVLGAGLVVVWQAQQSLKSSTPIAGVMNRSDTTEVEEADPEVKLGFADPAALDAPPSKPQPEAELFAKNAPLAFAASVPPESTPATGEAGKLNESARYRRSINFRENTPPATPADDLVVPESVPPDRLTDLNDKPKPARQDFDYGPTLLKPTTENDKAKIVPVAAEEPAAEPDPFSTAAPPPLKNAEPRLPVPVEEKPEPAPQPNLGTPEIEPFAPNDPKPAAPVPDRLLQNPPAEVKEDPLLESDPFAKDPPPARLPSDLDAPAQGNPPEGQPDANPPPAEAEPFDPFAPAKVPTPAAAPRVPADSLPTLDSPPARIEPAERTPLEREKPPRERRTNIPASDTMLGDGTAAPETPRGIQEPRLTIEKTAPPKAILGQPLVYSILLKNIGATPTNQILVEDRIPRGTRLIGTAPRAEMQDKRLLWKIGTLQPNEERRISIKVIPEEEGTIGSVAKVTFVTEIAADIQVSSAQLKLRVNGPSELRMQETAEFVFTLSNPSDTDAKNVVLRSLIPEGLTHPAGNDLEYKIEKLAAGESREVRLELTGAKVGRVTHHSIASAEGNLAAEAKTNIEIVGEQIVLTRSSPPKAYVGRQVVFSNKVGNEGQRPLQRVRVTESVPVGLEFVEASDGGIFDSSTRTITWNVGPLAIGGEHRVSATMSPKAVGQFESVVAATGPTGSVATVKPKLTIEGFPSLALEPLGDQRLVGVGEKFTSKLQIKNNGSAVAEHMQLTVNLPPELRLVSVKAPAAYQVSGQSVQFEPIDNLPARTAATFELMLEAVAAGDVRLELQIAADHLKRPVKHEEAVQIFAEK